MLSPGQIAERYFAACNAHDADAMVSMWEEGGVEVYPAFEERYRAPEDLRGHLSGWFAAAPDVHWDISSITADQERAVVHATMSGVWEESFQGWNRPERRFELETVDIIEVRNGRIARNSCIFDGGRMMRSLGLMPGRHSRAERTLQHAVNGLWRVRRAFRPR